MTEMRKAVKDAKLDVAKQKRQKGLVQAKLDRAMASQKKLKTEVADFKQSNKDAKKQRDKMKKTRKSASPFHFHQKQIPTLTPP